jgi:hypothetical protein
LEERSLLSHGAFHPLAGALITPHQPVAVNGAVVGRHHSLHHQHRAEVINSGAKAWDAAVEPLQQKLDRLREKKPRSDLGKFLSRNPHGKDQRPQDYRRMDPNIEQFIHRKTNEKGPGREPKPAGDHSELDLEALKGQLNAWGNSMYYQLTGESWTGTWI